jgi:hypothetical protein
LVMEGADQILGRGLVQLQRASFAGGVARKAAPGAAFAVSDPQRGDQRVTTTVVPTDTRSNRSLMSSFNMRMQP